MRVSGTIATSFKNQGDFRSITDFEERTLAEFVAVPTTIGTAPGAKKVATIKW